MDRPIILGYATNRGLKMVTREDAQRLTHINLAFGVIRDGRVDISGLPDIGLIEQVRQWNPDIKIVLSVGGWGAGGFSNMALTAEGRKLFVDSCAGVMAAHALDGVDIDWEYPCNGQAGIDHDPRDRETFTHLMRELKEMAGEDRIVSIAAGGGEYFIRDTQMDLVAECCDYVQLMTYDLRSGFCSQAGHHTSLYPSQGDEERIGAKTVVDMFINAGVPRDKIVIGAAFYSRSWGGVPDVNHGMLEQAQTIGGFGGGYGELKRNYIDKNGWVRYWDEVAQAPYLFNGNAFISYDDPRSVAAKCDYLKKEGLLGIMYWEHSCDDTKELLGAIYGALR